MILVLADLIFQIVHTKNTGETAWPSLYHFIEEIQIDTEYAEKDVAVVPKRQILVVSGDSAVRLGLHAVLCNEYTEVLFTESVEQAIGLCLKNLYDIIVIDLWQADAKGLDSLQSVQKKNMPLILVLVSELNVRDKILLPHIGAEMLLSGSKNAERLQTKKDPLQGLEEWDIYNHNPFVFGNELVIAPQYRRVIVKGRTVKLTRKEFDLLYFFCNSSRSGAEF